MQNEENAISDVSFSFWQPILDSYTRTGLDIKNKSYKYHFHQICLIFKTPTPCPSTSEIFPPPWRWTSNFKRTKSTQKQNQGTSHLNWQHVLLFDLAHKQCNGIIKGWLDCLTPESIGRFLVNNLLMFDWRLCQVMAQIKFSLTKK